MKYLAFITVAVLLFLGIMMMVHYKKPMNQRIPAAPVRPILVPVAPVRPPEKKPEFHIDLKFIENNNRKNR